MAMVWIAPGTFNMGSPASEQGRMDDDEDQHQVTLTGGYWLGKFPVTVAQWTKVMSYNPSSDPDEPQEAPVEFMRWDEAMAFCHKLTEQARRDGTLPEGYEYTLPTEAQWEFACRAGTTGPYGGDGVLYDMGWYRDNSGGHKHPVGKKKPNAWGLYDMHGNVWQWCVDGYGNDGYSAQPYSNQYPPGAAIDPFGRGQLRAIRGGSWRNDPANCRSAIRNRRLPSLRYAGNIGFRVALAPGNQVHADRVHSRWKDGVMSRMTGRKGLSSGPRQPQDWTVPEANLAMLWIAPGPFTMGSSFADERGRPDDDEDQHEVTLTKGYWLGKFPVTTTQWQVVMGNNPCADNNETGNGPVESITWNQAMEFCRRLTERAWKDGTLPDGYEYTLPTEAQWEYACRAGTTGAPGGDGGDGGLTDFGWFAENSGGHKHPVGEKRSNGWGLYDMQGNIWQWCLDGYGSYPTEATTDPAGPEFASRRVARGGSCKFSSAVTGSAFRYGFVPDYRDRYLGFRLALAQVNP